MSKYSRFSRGWCSPERYVQGPGEFDNIRTFSDKFGTDIVAIIDGFLYQFLREQLKKIYHDKRYSLRTYPFEGEITEKLILKRTREIAKKKPDIIIGIGGGKSIDTAKAIGAGFNIPLIVVPTIAATDAPTSSLSVLYNEDGSHLCERFYDHSPSLVLVDSLMIAQAPVRFLVSGMGDALATWIEAENNRKSNTPNLVYQCDGGHRQTLAGQTIARACYDALMKYGALAKAACEQNVVTEALENIIETNILLSGLGFENNETAGAHAINDGLTAVRSSKPTMHGEKVAFGCIVQLMAENAPKEQLHEVLDFCLDVGLPVCLEDLYVKPTEANMRKIAARSMHSNWKNMAFPIDENAVYSAIVAAENYSKQYKEKKGDTDGISKK